MIATLEKSELQTLFESQNYESDLLYGFRLNSLEIIESLPFPNSTMESWRRISLSNLKLRNFLNHPIPSPQIRVKNKNVVPEKFENLNVNQQEHCAQILKEYQEKQKQNYFAQLAFAFHSNVYYLLLDENIPNTESIELELEFTSLVGIPILIVEQKKFTNFILNLQYVFPETEEISFLNSVEILLQADSSKLELARVEDFGNSVFHFGNVFHSQARDSKSTLGFFNLGGYRGKTFVTSELQEKGASVEIIGACSTIQREQQDIEITVYHNASYTESNLLYRVAANDKSHHIFTGILHIPNSSRHVTAEQINNNIMLKKTARVESMPKLEVFAEDVRCAHGSTIGEVDEEQMFYLLSRGLTEQEARHLILEGFFSEVLDKISLETLRNNLNFRLLKKLNV